MKAISPRQTWPFCTSADSNHSPQLREAPVREEQAAIHRHFDHRVDAALRIKVSNAQKAEFAKRRWFLEVTFRLNAQLLSEANVLPKMVGSPLGSHPSANLNFRFRFLSSHDG